MNYSIGKRSFAYFMPDDNSHADKYFKLGTVTH